MNRVLQGIAYIDAGNSTYLTSVEKIMQKAPEAAETIAPGSYASVELFVNSVFAGTDSNLVTELVKSRNVKSPNLLKEQEGLILRDLDAYEMMRSGHTNESQLLLWFLTDCAETISSADISDKVDLSQHAEV